jgi:predicted GNAT family acetyltransferase
VRLHRHDSIDAFLDDAGSFLVAREAEHCLILGVAEAVRAQPPPPGEAPPYLAVVRDHDRIVAVAFQTPPWQLALSEVDDPAALDLIVADRRKMPLDQVVGPAEQVRAFAERWATAAGVTHRLTMRERIHRLTAVTRPRPSGGGMRLATTADRDRLIEWLAAFNAEALPHESLPDVGRLIDRWRVPGGSSTTFVWDDDGPVSFARTTGPTPHGIRIGPVYTPPEQRGRGYASNFVAAMSARELESGRHAVFLFTDLSNPTANHIYATIGYEPVRDVDQYRFG